MDSSTIKLEGADSWPQPPKFGLADQFLYDETKARFAFEMESAGVMHSKSVLFLTLTGIFAAFLTSLVSRLIEHDQYSYLKTAALCVLVACIGMLILAAILLGRSAIARYQTPALPVQWANHLWKLKQVYAGSDNADASILAHLNSDLLESWLEAVEQCAKKNEYKARILGRVSRLLVITILISFIGLVLVLLQAA